MPKYLLHTLYQVLHLDFKKFSNQCFQIKLLIVIMLWGGNLLINTKYNNSIVVIITIIYCILQNKETSIQHYKQKIR
jgi:hypothetical protein